MTANGVPAITVILSTYNRSNALVHAIRTVCWQTRTDWELLVIGDACSDDSEAVVAGFADERIRWINLEQRVGDQSGPNNRGLAEARGRHVAFLNHDDLWFPDHLASCLDELERSGADLVFSLPLVVFPDRAVRVSGVYPGGIYHPMLNPPVSAWVMRREFGARFGPFRSRQTCYGLPTHNLLFRAWKGGALMRAAPVASVIQIASGNRSGVYGERACHEQAHWFEAISRDPALRERAWAEAWLTPQPMHLRGYPTLALLKALGLRALGRIALWLGAEPDAVFVQILLRGKRGWLPRKGLVFEELYRRRGLEPFDKDGKGGT